MDAKALLGFLVGGKGLSGMECFLEPGTVTPSDVKKIESVYDEASARETMRDESNGPRTARVIAMLADGGAHGLAFNGKSRYPREKAMESFEKLAEKNPVEALLLAGDLLCARESMEVLAENLVAMVQSQVTGKPINMRGSE